MSYTVTNVLTGEYSKLPDGVAFTPLNPGIYDVDNRSGGSTATVGGFGTVAAGARRAAVTGELATKGTASGGITTTPPHGNKIT